MKKTTTRILLSALLLAAAASTTALAAPKAALKLAEATGTASTNISIPIHLIVDPASSPIEGITLNFAESDAGLELVSFAKSDALTDWTILDPLDPADGILSLGTFGNGLTGDVQIGTLVVKASNPGTYKIRLSTPKPPSPNDGKAEPSASIQKRAVPAMPPMPPGFPSSPPKLREKQNKSPSSPPSLPVLPTPPSPPAPPAPTKATESTPVLPPERGQQGTAGTPSQTGDPRSENTPPQNGRRVKPRIPTIVLSGKEVAPPQLAEGSVNVLAGAPAPGGTAPGSAQSGAPR